MLVYFFFCIDRYTDKLYKFGRVNYTWRWIKKHDKKCMSNNNSGPGKFKLTDNNQYKCDNMQNEWLQKYKIPDDELKKLVEGTKLI